RGLLRSTGCRSAPSPSRPRPFLSANRALVTSGNLAWAARAAAFRLRLGGGAVAFRLRFAMRASPPSTPLLRTPTTDRRLDTATRDWSTLNHLVRNRRQAETELIITDAATEPLSWKIGRAHV